MSTIKNVNQPLRHTVLALSLGLALSTGAATAVPNASGPELRLFPATIVEDLRRTGEVAAAMEAGVQSHIEAMDRQMGLYTASGCEGAELDPGCADMRRQINQAYVGMLEEMERSLPEMEKAVGRSRDSLRQRLASEIGRGASPSDLQAMLLDQRAMPERARRAGTGIGGGPRLSERFRQYHGLVSGAANGARAGRGSLAVTAADIYLDMQEAGELIALTRDEIARARLFANIDQAMPGLSPEMQQTVEGVKRVLFGEQATAMAVAEPPGGGNGPAHYVSPLEL